MESEPREVRAEARLRAGHAEVRHQREPEPAADRRAVNRADDRFPEPEQTDRLYIEVSDRLRLLAGPLSRAVERAAIAEIRARAKRLALGRQHDGAAAGILVERLERAGDLVDQRDVEEIVGRPPDLDEADEARMSRRRFLERTHLTFLSLLSHPRNRPLARGAVVRHQPHGAGAIVHVGEQRIAGLVHELAARRAGRV